VQRVGGVGTDEHVVARAAGHVLDVGLHVVALAGRAVVGAAVERDPDVRGVGAVVGQVAARPAGEHVGAAAAGQRVVALAAGEPVGRPVAGQDVARRAADEVLDVALDVVALAVDAVVGDRVERGEHGCRRRRVVGGVAGALAAVQLVGAGRADELVGARAAAQGVVALPAGERVVAAAALEPVDRRAAGQPVGAGAAGDDLDVAAHRVALAGLAVVRRPSSATATPALRRE
jgi:hypothetical protein